ncbi:alpha/beta hydrolase [Legionella waltersii]|uniref:Carboxylesterase/phospholipase n=2 Tax=Legionella waltersii TaxID=66969 RepID=A0A0W1A294_9GAMM|nr:alpha/beta hydrolase [Legionella waltersii]KTD75479.1 carboxylesterase/phospholipase [Legionella waltersii]SNU98198.1 carboxylesterase/phospholipase [Legionella waltersii]
MTIYTKEPQVKAQACIIWMHGLGADASDMMGLADQLNDQDLGIKHVFLDAPLRSVTLNNGMIMPAWYDIIGLDLIHREDKEGIEESAAMIRSVLDSQLQSEFTSQQLFLAGFSQGGAMALHTALNYEGSLGGIIALSAYIPLANHIIPSLDGSTPIFMGAGQYDPLVLPKWTQQSKNWLLSQGFKEISYHEYPMEHSVCFEELKDLGLWLNQQIQGAY